MSPRTVDPRLKAGLIVGAVFVLGVVAGVAGERTLIQRNAAERGPSPLTVEEMAGALRLESGQRARVAAVLDSLRPDIVRAAAHGADSLRVAALRARARITEAVPPARRPEFQQWLDAHHAHMMQMMHGMDHRMMGPGMMGPEGMPPEMMGPGRRPEGGPGPDMRRPGGRSDSAGPGGRSDSAPSGHP